MVIPKGKGRRKNHLKDPEKLSENYLEEFSAKRSSLTLKKLCCKFYKVIEVPWGTTPQDFPSSSIQHGLDAAFQPVYLVFY